MRGKFVLLMVLFILVMTMGLAGCAKKEAPPPIDPTKGKLPPAKELTPKEKFQAQIKPMVDIINAAKVLDATAKVDDAGFTAISGIKGQLDGGAAFADIQKANPTMQFQGLFSAVKPVDVCEKFVSLVKDVPAGKTSAILQVPGQGFGTIYISKIAADGLVEVGFIIALAGPQAVTTATPGEKNAGTPVVPGKPKTP